MDCYKNACSVFPIHITTNSKYSGRFKIIYFFDIISGFIFYFLFDGCETKIYQDMNIIG